MRGNVPQLKDVVLHLTPQTEIDLQCYEQFDSSKEEDEVDNMRDQLPERRAGQATCYRIEAPCCRCSSVVQLAVESSGDTLRVVQQMLMGELSLVCPCCANN
uniref:Protein E7 n=1 Tax=Human papillomavirus 51 TaxID=10595 RepID=A0A0P0ESS3_HPV51|nr:early protein E7 [human papillomavirus 51]